MHIEVPEVVWLKFSLMAHHTVNLAWKIIQGFTGQYYVKIFEKLDLDYGNHLIQIVGDANDTEKTIDMLSISEDLNSKE